MRRPAHRTQADFFVDFADFPAATAFAGFAAGAIGQMPNDLDMLAIPDIPSFTPLPWKPEVARFACDVQVEGEEWPYCPRTILRRQLARAEEMGDNLDIEAENNREALHSVAKQDAFALATGIAAHYDGWIVPTIVYSVATGVAMSRVNDRAHFVSDVLAGALIGRGIAKGIVARHTRGNLAWTLTPSIVNGRPALFVRVQRR